MPKIKAAKEALATANSSIRNLYKKAKAEERKTTKALKWLKSEGKKLIITSNFLEGVTTAEREAANDWDRDVESEFYKQIEAGRTVDELTSRDSKFDLMKGVNRYIKQRDELMRSMKDKYTGVGRELFPDRTGGKPPAAERLKQLMGGGK